MTQSAALDHAGEKADGLDSMLRAAGELAGLSGVDVLTAGDLLEIAGAASQPLSGQKALCALLVCQFAALSEGGLSLDIYRTADGGVPCTLHGQLTRIFSADACGLQREILLNLKNDAWPELIARAASRETAAEDVEFKPLVLFKRDGGEHLAFHRYFCFDSRFRRNLQARLSAADPAADDVLMEEALREVTGRSAPDARQNGQQIALRLALRKNFVIITGGPGTGKTFIVLAILRALCRLGTDPGQIVLAAPTGRAAARMAESVRRSLCALPEAQASEPDRQLARKLPEASTIHRLLSYRPASNDYGHNADNPLPAKVVVIDEASMIDVCQMARLFEAIPPDARIILLGDKDQLPAVEAGAALTGLLPERCVPGYSRGMAQWLGALLDGLPHETGRTGDALCDRVAMLSLENGFRLSGKIKALAMALSGSSGGILADEMQKAELTPRFAEQGGPAKRTAVVKWPESKGAGEAQWLNIAALNRGEWPLILESWARHHYLDKTIALGTAGEKRTYKELAAQAAFISWDASLQNSPLLEAVFSAVADAQVLCVMREGAYGCEGVNRTIASFLRRQFGANPSGGFFSGEPVLITQNDYANNLFNGDIGVALTDAAGLTRILVPRSRMQNQSVITEYRAFPAERVKSAEPAFAITVHKSQGSEYGHVLMAAPPLDGAGAAAPPGSPEWLALRRMKNMLTRQIVYTGLTRAKSSIVLCMDPPALSLVK